MCPVCLVVTCAGTSNSKRVVRVCIISCFVSISHLSYASLLSTPVSLVLYGHSLWIYEQRTYETAISELSPQVIEKMLKRGFGVWFMFCPCWPHFVCFLDLQILQTPTALLLPLSWKFFQNVVLVCWQDIAQHLCLGLTLSSHPMIEMRWTFSACTLQKSTMLDAHSQVYLLIWLAKHSKADLCCICVSYTLSTLVGGALGHPDQKAHIPWGNCIWQPGVPWLRRLPDKPVVASRSSCM